MKKYLLTFILLFCLTSCSIITTSNETYNNVYFSYKTNKPYLALTFDDGPHKIQTYKVLSILKKYNIKATFFVIGENIEYQKDVLKDIYNQGHEIGNHMYAHENINKMSRQEIIDSINKTDKLIYEVTGKYSKVIRPPYGIVNNNLKQICYDMNKSIILWGNFKDSKDWSLISVNEIIKNVSKNTSNGDIYLFHDGSKKYVNTITAIDIIIPRMMEKGYYWTTISTLIEK